MGAMSRTLLLIFAHPDDESFLTGGTICRYVAEGVRVVLATATRGEAGKTGAPPVCTSADLPAIREGELRTAAGILGIARLEFLGSRDRELHLADPEDMRRRLVSLVREERPQVVLSFDPNGANLHPDHVAISRFSLDAVTAASDARWYPEAGPAFDVPRLAWVIGRRPWQWLREPGLASRPGVDFVVDVSAWRHRKLAALQAHATQHQSVDRNFLSQPDRDVLLGAEIFRQAFGPAPRQRPSGDLFEGV